MPIPEKKPIQHPGGRYLSCLAVALVHSLWLTTVLAAPLRVSSDFEGASVDSIAIDQDTRTIRFVPGGDPIHGWPCWWYFRIDGTTPGEEVTLSLQGSKAVVGKPGRPMQRPLAPSWAMPHRASISADGKSWSHTEKGTRVDKDTMTYTIRPMSTSIHVAWGPPYTPTRATEFVKTISQNSPHAHADELCRSRGGRAVPMLHIKEGELPDAQRFGIWVQARQHAWESGSSWVAQGFAEWLLSDTPEAAWLRQHAEVFIVPIMDVDNTATGNGGKDAQPWDHNRDWAPKPHWNEVAAAKNKVSALIKAHRMDVFLDLHNPAPGDPTFFYVLDDKLLQKPMIDVRNRFIELAYKKISSIKPMIPMSNKPKTTGASYHPLWRQISANWVSMNGNPETVSLCLETIWNAKTSTTGGYRAVGASLAGAVSEFLSERPAATQ